MELRDGGKAPGEASKLAWRSPRLEEIGNLREFVREGNANGKSQASIDGTTSGNNESMLMN